MPKVAFVFPGQGSQSLGLLRSLTPHFSIIEATFSEASQVLGYDLWKLAQEGPLEKINQTVYTQPIILTASMALWRVWCEQVKILPDFLAGHSVGEYSAYTCASSIVFEKAVQLVSNRGLYMQEAASDQGAMAAIVGLSFEKVTALCRKASHAGYVAPANYNAPTQVIISGYVKAVDHAISLAKQSGAKLSQKIPVSVPAHCLLMKPAVEHLATALHKIPFLVPQIPVINTVHVKMLEKTHTIKKSFIEHLYSPVRWSESIQWLIEQDVECFIECGPGQVLSRLIRQIAPRAVTTFSICEYKSFCKTINYLALIS